MVAWTRCSEIHTFFILINLFKIEPSKQWSYYFILILHHYRLEDYIEGCNLYSSFILVLYH